MAKIPVRGLALAGLLGALAACGFTETGTRIREFAAVKGAEAYDKGLENAEFFVCQAASIGSVQRRYGRSRELAEAWRTICLGDGAAAVDLISLPAEAAP